MSILPKGWVWTRLGDILSSVKGKKPKELGLKSKALNVLYINIKAFERNIFEQYTDGVGCELCNNEDILIVWDGARCGLVGRGVAGAIGSTLAKLTYYELDSSYLFYFLQTKYDYINKRPRGVGIPHVEPDIFWNAKFPLSPLLEQHYIVAKIEELFTKLNAGIEVLKQIKAQLKRYRQAVLKHAFEGKLTEEWRKIHKDELEPAPGLLKKMQEERKKKGKFKALPTVDISNLPELPAEWTWTRVGRVYEIIGGGTPSTKVTEYWSGDIPWITSADIHGLKDIRPRKYINKKAIENSATNLVREGSLVVVTRVGLGKIALTDVPLCFSQDSQALVSNNKLIFSDYALYHLSQNVQVFKYKHRGTTINGVTKRQLAELPFALPPMDEQKKIVDEIEQRISLADEVERTVDQSLEQTDRLRQSILKKAFEGRLVPQNPNDEPAVKLLERIKAEKEKHGAEKITRRKPKKGE